ncbi:hypothetical protein D3C85_1646320 [compost metagenome]
MDEHIFEYRLQGEHRHRNVQSALINLHHKLNAIAKPSLLNGKILFRMLDLIPEPHGTIQLSQIIAEQVGHSYGQITRLFCALKQRELGQHIQGIKEKVRVHLILQHL